MNVDIPLFVDFPLLSGSECLQSDPITMSLLEGFTWNAFYVSIIYTSVCLHLYLARFILLIYDFILFQS